VLGRAIAERGGAIERAPAVAWLVVGLGLLRLAALVPVLGFFLWLALSAFGVGAAVRALVRHRAATVPDVSPPPASTSIHTDAPATGGTA
jgi:hypothetical protein